MHGEIDHFGNFVIHIRECLGNTTEEVECQSGK